MHFPVLEARTAEVWSQVGIPQEEQRILWGLLGQLERRHLKFYSHSLRVGIYAYHLSTPNLKPLATAVGGIHDVGKVRCDDDLLADTINAAQYERMKLHSRYGYELVKPLLPLHSYGVGMHHFRNGSGYGVPLEEMWPDCPPQARDMLLRLAQTVGMSDCFDALQYRPEPRSTRGDLFDIDVEDISQIGNVFVKEHRVTLEEGLSAASLLFDVRKQEFSGERVFAK